MSHGDIYTSKLYGLVLNRFGTVDLLDDIEDHWDSNTHLKERKEFLLRLQQHTKLTGQRVSFISGDVHAAQVGRTYTYPKVQSAQAIDEDPKP